MSIILRKGNTRLPPEVNRVLYFRNLPFNITSEEMYDIFGKYGAIRQIQIGTNKDTRDTAFVVYEDIYYAKTAVDHLSGVQRRQSATFDCLLKTYGFLTPDFWENTNFIKSSYQQHTDLLAKPTSKVVITEVTETVDA